MMFFVAAGAAPVADACAVVLVEGEAGFFEGGGEVQEALEEAGEGVLG